MTTDEIRKAAQTAHRFYCALLDTEYTVMFRNYTNAPFLVSDAGTEYSVDEFVAQCEWAPVSLIA